MDGIINDIYRQREGDGNGPDVAVCLQRGSIGALGQRFEDLQEMFDLYLMANNKTAEQKKNAISLIENWWEATHGTLLTVYRSKRKADKSDTYDETRKMTLEKAVEIATALENIESNIKGLHAPTEKELWKHGVGQVAQQ